MQKFGIIGMGIRGKMYASVISQNPNAEVRAICDTNEAVLKEMSEKYGAEAYTDFHDMIDRGDINVVIVATPDFMHREAVLYAASHKLNMMVEKPFSTSVEECREMTDVIRENGVKCLVAFENRWSLPFINTKAMIDAGDVGNILNIYALLNDTEYVPKEMLPWAGKSTPAWFLFPHIIDMASWYTGKEVKRVYATGVKKKLAAEYIDTYDSVEAILTYKDGTSGVFTTTWVLPESYPVVADQKMMIVGEKSSISIDLCEQMVKMASPDKFQNPRILGTPVNGHLNAPPAHMLNGYIDVLENDGEPLATEEDGLRNTIIIAAIHESIRTGMPVDIEE